LLIAGESQWNRKLRIEVAHAHGRLVDPVEHVHDDCLVRPFEIQERAVVADDPVSWLIALPEYALQVPANRIGHGEFSAPQLKIVQECISIGVFVVFSALYLKEAPNWRTGLAMAMIVAAVVLAVPGSPSNSTDAETIATEISD
jgi:uncharacterized protein (DUF486 family)